jgi:hypothetical protein
MGAFVSSYSTGIPRPNPRRTATVVRVDRGQCTLDSGVRFNVAACWRSGHGDADLPRVGEAVEYLPDCESVWRAEGDQQ